MRKTPKQKNWETIIREDIMQSYHAAQGYKEVTSKYVLDKTIRLFALNSFVSVITFLLAWVLHPFALVFFAIFLQAAFFYGFILLKIRLYRKIEKYFDVQKILIKKSSSLEKLKNRDVEKVGIDPLLVEDINSIISLIGIAFTQLERSIMIIHRGLWYFSNNTKLKIRDLIFSEKLWMIGYMRECQSILSGWMSHHETELRQIIEQNSTIEKNIPGGTSAIELANTRLSSHIENLERVRIKI